MPRGGGVRKGGGRRAVGEGVRRGEGGRAKGGGGAPRGRWARERGRERAEGKAGAPKGVAPRSAGVNSPLGAPPWAESGPRYSSAACPDSSTRRASARSSSSEDGMNTTRC
ncbi:hypothetical protein FSY75_20360 [Streptomyces sp. TR1341]|nr:hypothetical protein [Streptomyces sp. TR1341]